jgi:hypothetical protein
MRAYVLAAFVVLLSGCATAIPQNELIRWSKSLGVSEAELGEIAQQVRSRHGLQIVRFDRRSDGAIAVMLAERRRPHGIVVVYRRLGNRWVEDPTSQAEWIAKAQPPNKAPEPTTFAVTPRATVRVFEMQHQNPNRDVARVAPAKVVAHL